MQQAVMIYAISSTEKLREQQPRFRHINVSIATGRHINEPQYSNTASRICDYPTNDTRDIIVLALGGLSTTDGKATVIQKPGYAGRFRTVSFAHSFYGL